MGNGQIKESCFLVLDRLPDSAVFALYFIRIVLEFEEMCTAKGDAVVGPNRFPSQDP